jgi:hypothetical protein
MITLDEGRLRDAPFSDDPVKGATVSLTRWSMGLGGTYQSVFDAPTRASLFPATGMLALEGAVHGFLRRDWVWGFDVAMGSASGTVVIPPSSTLAPFHFTELSTATSITVEWPHRFVTPFVGGRLALLLMSRRFDDDAFPPQFFSTLSPGIVGGATFHVTRSMGLLARGRVHYLLYNVDENRSLGYWELATAVTYDF